MTPSLSRLPLVGPYRLIPHRLLCRNSAGQFHTCNADKVELQIISTNETNQARLERISIAHHLKRRQSKDNAIRRSINDTAQPRLPDDEKSLVLMNPEDLYKLQYSNHSECVYPSIPDQYAELRRRLERSIELQTMQISSREYKAISNIKAARRLLKCQLDRCRSTRDIFRLVAAALADQKTTGILQNHGKALIEAFYRVRAWTSDLAIAKKIWVLIRRFEKAGLQVQTILLMQGLMFAVRSRDLPITKKFFQGYRARGLRLGPTAFRLLIAKFSVGRKGMGEIRNGQWKRDEIMQVLLGFPDIPPGQECHLGSFVNRDDWPYVAAWTKILSRCGAMDELQKEWIIWKNSEKRRLSEPLQAVSESDMTYRPFNDWRIRGDRWFVQRFAEAGALEIAWQIVRETGLDPMITQQEPLHLLLERPDLATAITPELKQAMIQKLDDDLSAIENAMGVKWVTNNGTSYHAPTDDYEEALEKLSDPDLFARHGYFG